MDAQRFLAEFGHIANAPGGVARLRELVLHLAVTGKLLLQIPTDEHAEKVLERMRLATISVGAKKRGRQKKVLDERYSGREQPIPSGWVMAELGELGDWGAGSTPSRSNSAYYGGNIPWFKSGELKADYITKSEEFVSELALKECSLRLNAPGDVLIAMYGANIGQTAIIGIKSTTNQAVCACTPHEGLINRFLLLLLRGLKNHFISLGAGGAQPNISKEKIVATLVGLPPTAEQSRIVAKVDELMALCDKLEAQQQARRKLQNLLRQSTLQTVASAQSPQELQANWTRLEQNFGRLFSKPEDVKELRSLVLELAVRGFLTEQCDTDESTEQQLAAIRSVAGSRQESGRRKKAVAYKPVEPSELEYGLPKGWSFARLGELVRVINGRAYSKSELLDRGTPVLRVGNLFTSKDWYYSNLELEDDKYCDAGDLLYAWSASFGPFIWSGPKVIFHYHIWKLELFSEANLSKDFLYMVLQERTEAIKLSGHGISMAHMTKERMEQLPIAIPPLDEQMRIMARVSALMRICDDLAVQLRDAQKVAEKMAGSAISSITGITPQQEDQPMKAPQTELVSLVCLGAAPGVKDKAPLAALLARHNGEMSARDLWQRYGGEIDAFYAQLKTEVANGWIQEPAGAEMRVSFADAAEA